MALTLHLVRHGQTDWNVAGRMQGWIDRPLTDVGISQAQQVADRLAARPISAIFASDLTRARHTAEIIAGPHRVGVSTDQRLRERHYGVIDGRLVSEAATEYGERWEPLLYGVDETFSGGETVRQHYARAAAFLNELISAAPVGEIVVVSHGATLRRLRSHLRGGLDQEDWSSIDNAQILTADIDASGARFRP